MTIFKINRRGMLIGMGGAMALGAVRPSFAQNSFPSSRFNVIVPTGQGGNADMMVRAFANSWSPMLNNQLFEYEYHPAASGQVGYELFINQRPHDGYNMLFGNMGPEMIMYVTQSPSYKFPGDYTYFCGVDVDDCGIYTRRDSRFQSLEDVIEEARKTPVNISMTRMAHPGALGLLALAEETGAKFNLIPYGGGNPALTAVVNGEVELGGGGISGVPNEANGALRVLTVFNRSKNQLAHMNENAPLVNDVLGTNLPDFYTTRSFAMHNDWIASNPEHFAMLKTTAAKVFDEPSFEEGIKKTTQPWDAMRYLDQEGCMAYAKNIAEVAERFKDQITAAK